MLSSHLKKFLRTSTAVLVPMEDEYEPIVVPMQVSEHHDFDSWVLQAPAWPNLCDVLTEKVVELLDTGKIAPDALWGQVEMVHSVKELPLTIMQQHYEPNAENVLKMVVVLYHGKKEVAQAVWYSWTRNGSPRAAWDQMDFSSDQTYWHGANPFQSADVKIICKSAILEKLKTWKPDPPKPVYEMKVVHITKSIAKYNDPLRYFFVDIELKLDGKDHFGRFRVVLNTNSLNMVTNNLSQYDWPGTDHPFKGRIEKKAIKLAEDHVLSKMHYSIEGTVSSGGPNIQQIPKASKSSLAEADYSKLEAAVLGIEKGTDTLQENLQKIKDTFGKAATFGFLYGGEVSGKTAIGSQIMAEMLKEAKAQGGQVIHDSVYFDIESNSPSLDVWAKKYGLSKTEESKTLTLDSLSMLGESDKIAQTADLVLGIDLAEKDSVSVAKVVKGHPKLTGEEDTGIKLKPIPYPSPPGGDKIKHFGDFKLAIPNDAKIKFLDDPQDPAIWGQFKEPAPVVYLWDHSQDKWVPVEKMTLKGVTHASYNKFNVPVNGVDHNGNMIVLMMKETDLKNGFKDGKPHLSKEGKITNAKF